MSLESVIARQPNLNVNVDVDVDVHPHGYRFAKPPPLMFPQWLT